MASEVEWQVPWRVCKAVYEIARVGVNFKEEKRFEQSGKKEEFKLMNIYQTFSVNVFHSAPNKLLNIVRYRSLGRSAAALLRAAYCGVRCKRFAQNHECFLAAYRAEAGKIVVDFWYRVGRLMAANVSGIFIRGSRGKLRNNNSRYRFKSKKKDG